MGQKVALKSQDLYRRSGISDFFWKYPLMFGLLSSWGKTLA